MTETISNFYDRTFENSRQAYVGNKSALSVIGQFSGHLQQKTPEPDEFMNVVSTITWFIWCDTTEDIKIGDTIEDLSTSLTYNVEQIINYQSWGDNKHLQLTVQLNKS